MSDLIMIRHGRTVWNQTGQLTGRADIELTPEGRDEVAARRLPDRFAQARWHVSPLIRARQTAALLGRADARVDERLIEMDFGAFEGRTLADLRADPDIDMAAMEDQGLDFQPPDGESPRAVRQRLQPFLDDLAAADGLHIAVAHKSIIRAIFADAYDWPMLGRPPVKLKWDRLHHFALTEDAQPRPVEMNIPFETAEAAA